MREGHFFKIVVGIGSRSQEELLDDEMSLEISSAVAGMKWGSRGGVIGGLE
jgi:hypothetical protein